MAGPVLLVHDDIAEIAAVRRLLVRDGYEVMVVSSAADALIAFGHYLPSLIILSPSVEGMRGSVILEELRGHPDAKLARVLLLGETIAGFGFQVAPLPLDGGVFLQQVAELIRGGATEADQWTVMDSSQRQAVPAARHPTRDEWRATAPPEVGSAAGSNDIFNSDWQVAAMTPEERDTHERTVVAERNADAAVSYAFEQTHQEIEAEAIASIERTIPAVAAPSVEEPEHTEPGVSTVEDLIHDTLSSPVAEDPVLAELQVSLAERRKKREDERRSKEEVERQMREGGMPLDDDADAERAKLVKARQEAEQAAARERERAEKLRARAARIAAEEASLFEPTPPPGPKLDASMELAKLEAEMSERTAQTAAQRIEAALAREDAEAAAASAQAATDPVEPEPWSELIARGESRSSSSLEGHQPAQVEDAVPAEADAVAQREVDEAARVEAEAAAQRELEAVSRRDAEEAARAEAEAAAQREVEAAARIEAEAVAQREAEEAARIEAEAVAQREAEEAARIEAEAVAQREAEEAARIEAEAVAQREAEDAARIEAEAVAQREAEEAARIEAEAAAQREVEEAARADALAAAERELAEAARADAEAAAQRALAPEPPEMSGELSSQSDDRPAFTELDDEIAATPELLAAAGIPVRTAAQNDIAALLDAEIGDSAAETSAGDEIASTPELEEAARVEAEAAAQREIEAASRVEAEAAAQREIEAAARIDAEAAAQREIEAAARIDAEAAAQREIEAAARVEAEAAAQREIEAAARVEAEAAAQREIDEVATAELARLEAEAAEQEKLEAAEDEAATRAEIERLSLEASEKARALAEAGAREALERARREELEKAAKEAEARADTEAQLRVDAETRAHTQLQKLSSEREEARLRSIRLAEEAAEREVAANEAQSRAAEFEEQARAAREETAHAETRTREERERREQLTLELERLRQLAEQAQERARTAEDEAKRERAAHVEALRAAGQQHVAAEQAARAEAAEEARASLETKLAALQLELENQRQTLEAEKRTALASARQELEAQRRDIEEQLKVAADEAERARAEAKHAASRTLIPLDRPGKAPLPVMGAGAVNVRQLASLISKLSMSKSEARLELQADDSLRTVWFRKGAIVGAASTVPHDSLLDRARRDGLIDARQENELRLVRTAGSTEILRVLKLRGYVRDTEAVPLVQRHHEQVALEAMSEQQSTYRLSLEPILDEVVSAELPRPPMHIVAEALRRALSSEEFLRSAGGMSAAVALTDTELDGKALGFTDRERRMLSLIDGQVTVEELLLGAGIKQDQGLKALAVAHALHLIEVTPPVEEPTAAPADRDIERLEAKYEELADADYFSLLGLTRAAGTDEVARAFENLTREFDPIKFVGHPDAGLQHRARLVSEALSEAARALQDDRLRTEYARNLLD